MIDLLNIRVLLGLARQTLRDPKGGARVVMGLNLPLPVLGQFFLLLLVLSAMLKVVVFGVYARSGQIMPENAAVSLTAAEAIISIGLTFAMFYIGRIFKGQGSLIQAFALVVWLQFILLCLNVVQLGLLFISEPLSQMLTLFALALFFWLLAQFIAALHGFPSLGRIFLGIVLTMMAMAFVFNIIFALLGFQVA